jgi:hypothetical protein
MRVITTIKGIDVMEGILAYKTTHVIPLDIVFRMLKENNCFPDIKSLMSEAIIDSFPLDEIEEAYLDTFNFRG